MKWNLLKINKNKNFIVTITINVLTKYFKQKNVNHVIIWSYLENNNDYHTLDYHNIVYAECAIESA